MGQSIYLSGKCIKTENSWVNRLSRRDEHGKCIKTEHSKLMGPSINLADIKLENTLKLKI